MNRRGLDCFAALLERNGFTVRRMTSRDAIKFCCPLHKETNPSANATVGDRVPVIARCHPCGDEGNLMAMLEVLNPTDEERAEILGHEPREEKLPKPKVGSGVVPTALQITTPVGNVVTPAAQPPGEMREVRRWVHQGFDGKSYSHVRLEDGTGRKSMPWEPKGVKPEELPLYGSQAIPEANGKPMLLVEGEKAADALKGIDEIVALGTVTGADGVPCRRALEVLVGRPVFLWPDADDPGFRHMERIGAALEGLAASVGVFPPDVTLGPKADAFDFVEKYGTEAVLVSMSRALSFADWKRERIEGRRGWKLATAEELVSKVIEPIPSLLGNGLLPVGFVSIAYGYPGVGKSFLLDAGLALAISRGEPWLGLETKKARVLVLAAEWPAAIAQQHLKQYDVGFDRDLVYVTAEHLRVPVLLDRPEEISDLISYASGFELVIIDPLGRFSGVDLDIGFEAAKVMLGAQALAASGPAVLLVHHSRKRSGNSRESFEGDLDDLRGSSRLQSDPVSVFKIAKHPSKKIVLSFPKANFGRAPDPIWIQPSWDGPPEITTSPEEGAALRRRGILDFLRQYPDGISAEVVAKSLKISHRSIRRYLKEVGAINVSGKGTNAIFCLPGTIDPPSED